MEKFKIFKNYKKIVAGFFDKSAGNIDFRFGEKKTVLANRKKMTDELKINLEDIYEMDQVHGNKIVILDKKTIKNHVLPKTDAIVTNLPGVILMIKTADCFPVIFFDMQKEVVAAVHVGWRGATEKIFLETLLVMINHFGSNPENILVAVGPGAGKCCFSHNHFIQEKLPEWKDYLETKASGKSLNIPKFIKDKLIAYGIGRNNIQESKICTICNDDFFSHFRSLTKKEPEGRFATIIGLIN